MANIDYQGVQTKTTHHAKVASMPKIADTIKEIRSLGLTCVRESGNFVVKVPGTKLRDVQQDPITAVQGAWYLLDMATRP